MIERGERPRLAREARLAIGITREQRGQDFQRDITAERGVARAIDFAHAASAEATAELKATEERTFSKRHFG